MGIWVPILILLPCLYFAFRCSTDYSSHPPRYWQQPRSYGVFLLIAAAIWTGAWLSPVLWHHREAFDRQDMKHAALLGSDLLAILPGGLGVLLVGVGAFLAASAWQGVGRRQYCLGCGYERAATRILSSRCPECDRHWSWFGEVRIGSIGFCGGRAALGATCACLGAAGIVVQWVL
jgi:hypothetical protein